MHEIVFLKGKPGAGKTTILKNLEIQDYVLVDSDNVDKQSKEFLNFKPKKTRNYTPELKLYSFNLHRVINHLQKNSNVIWAHTWFNQISIENTIRNIAYYLCKIENIWNIDIKLVIENLKLNISIIELVIPDNESHQRVYRRHSEIIWIKNEEPRLNKFLKNYSSYEEFNVVKRFKIDTYIKNIDESTRELKKILYEKLQI